MQRTFAMFVIFEPPLIETNSRRFHVEISSRFYQTIFHGYFHHWRVQNNSRIMDWMNKIGTITWSYLRKYYNPCQPVSLRLFSNVASHRNHSEHYFHAPWRITSISKQYYSFYFVIFIEDKLSNSLNIQNIILYELSGVHLRQVRRFSTGNIAITDKLSVTVSFMHHNYLSINNLEYSIYLRKSTVWCRHTCKTDWCHRRVVKSKPFYDLHLRLHLQLLRCLYPNRSKSFNLFWINYTVLIIKYPTRNARSWTWWCCLQCLV